MEAVDTVVFKQNTRNLDRQNPELKINRYKADLRKHMTWPAASPTSASYVKFVPVKVPSYQLPVALRQVITQMHM